MATTALLSEQESILWRIPNFSQVCKSKEMLAMQHFQSEMQISRKPKGIHPLKWEYRLILLDSTSEEHENNVSIQFTPVNVPTELTKCHAKIQIQIGDAEKCWSFLIRDIILHMGRSKSLMEYPKLSQSLFRLTADGALEIRVTVTVYHLPAEQSALAALEAHYENVFVHNLRAQLTGLGENPINIRSTPVKFVSMDGKEFYVDRVILAARSSVFLDMFQSDMSEQQKRVVEVKDVDSKPLEVLLHFIQTAKLLNWKDESVIDGLVHATHKYMLKDLLEFFDEVLGLVCTKGNCGKLMVLAKTFGMKKAQKKLLEYFRKNLASNVDDLLKFVDETAVAKGSRISHLHVVEEVQPEQPKLKRLRRRTNK